MAIQVKIPMKSTGVKVQHNDVAMPAKSKSRTITEHPEVRLNSKNIDGLKSLSLDSKCILTFEAEVIRLEEPGEWEKERGGMKEGDVMATFKLVKASLQPVGEASSNYESAHSKASKNQ